MDLKIQHLKLLVDARQTLLNGKNANTARLNYLRRKGNISEEGANFLQEQGIEPFEEPLSKFRVKIIDILNFIPVYQDYLKDISGVSAFDCANLIILVEDIERFGYLNQFKSYCGVTPVVECHGRVHKMRKGVDYSDCIIIGDERAKIKSVSYNERIKILMSKIINQLIKYNEDYMDAYNVLWEQERVKASNITKKHVNNRVKRKLAQKFLKEFYIQWKELNKGV